MPQPTLVTIPAEATDPSIAPILNLNGERVVDVMAGTDAADTLIGWLDHGDNIGDELIVRFIKRTGGISSGTDSGNRATIRLKVLSPQRRKWVSSAGFGDGKTENFDLPAYPDTAPSGLDTGDAPWPESPLTLVIFRWSGAQWLPVYSQLP